MYDGSTAKALVAAAAAVTPPFCCSGRTAGAPSATRAAAASRGTRKPAKQEVSGGGDKRGRFGEAGARRPTEWRGTNTAALSILGFAHQSF